MSKRFINKEHLQSLCQLAIVALLLMPLSVFAADSVDSEQSSVLQDRALEFFVRINEARLDPLAAAERLGVSEASVREVFADDLWILEEGLAPLAWNHQLASSGSVHVRDMFDRLYYSYVTPEGLTVEQRVAATGYDALFVGETMNALFFENYVALDDALKFLADIMLRDELAGTAGVDRNFFSPDVTEIGICFMAESIRLLGEQPYVYLLLADFARPLENQEIVIVQHDADSQLLARSFIGRSWLEVDTLRPGLSQFVYPDGGGELFTVVADDSLPHIAETASLFDYSLAGSQTLDLRVDDLVDPLTGTE